jgi:hypothetical protein
MVGNKCLSRRIGKWDMLLDMSSIYTVMEENIQSSKFIT